MPVQIEGAGEVTGLNAVDVPVYADAAARDAALTAPIEGQLVWLTDEGALTVYDGAAWELAGKIPAADFSNTATGTYTDDGVNYKYLTFTASGTLTITKTGFVDVFIVGGGGSGGSGQGNCGGGGAGGVLDKTVYFDIGSHPIVVGAGGPAFTGANQAAALTGYPGIDSSAGIYFAPGGGGGGMGSRAGGNGGSGGGAGVNVGTGGTALYSVLRGNNGAGAPSNVVAGGGGGSGAAGSGKNGGAGSSTTITGSTTSYAAGGGGGTNNDAPGSGGSPGGGTGGWVNAGPTNGSANTGSGGGGAGNIQFTIQGCGAGGSGVVIVRTRV